MVEDFLGLAKSTLYAFGALAAAVIGPNTGVPLSGLQISPTGPASMQVVIGTGSIYENETVDATAYSTLGTDSNITFKQGILAAPVTLTVTAPATSGYSQFYLVEAAYNDTDDTAIVPPYLNSANPLVPWAGANNAGGSQFVLRQGICAITLKPGVAAPAGTQTVPAVDAGFVPLWVILVTHGQTTITSANWYQVTGSGSPWFPNLEGLSNQGNQNTAPATQFVPVIPATTFYVDSVNGNDTFDGLSATVTGTHGPWATGTHAVSTISQYQYGGLITVNFAVGTYAAISISTSLIPNWNLVGAGRTTCNIGGISVSGTLSANISGFNFNGSGGGGGCYASGCANVTVNTCNFAGQGTLNDCVYATQGAAMIVEGTIAVTGTSQAFLSAASGGSINFGSGAITYTSATFSVANIVASVGSAVTYYAPGVTVTWSGTPTGPRYYANLNGIVNSTGSGSTFFPGSSAGSVATGGQYD